MSDVPWPPQECYGLWPPNPNSTVKKKTIRFLNDKKTGNALSIAAMISRVYSCISSFVRWPPGWMWRQGHCMTQYWPVQHVLCVCVTKGEAGDKENWVPKFSFIVSHNRKGRREGCDWNGGGVGVVLKHLPGDQPSGRVGAVLKHLPGYQPRGGVGWSWSISLVTSQISGPENSLDGSVKEHTKSSALPCSQFKLSRSREWPLRWHSGDIKTHARLWRTGKWELSNLDITF